MPLSFYTILAAQFFSALADNALLPAAIALLIELSAPKSYVPILQVFFVVSYIAFAPFVGAFADAFPKGRVMSTSNAVKFVGCIAMLLGAHPLIAYGIVGFGAAAYSPAKYGILTELLPSSKLVAANAWMEGLTVAAIILGLGLGGYLQNGSLYAKLEFIHPLVKSPAQMAIAMICLLYVIAALFNLYIPRLPIDHKLPKKNPLYMIHDFWHCFKLLWRDPLGQVSLAVTTLFWGAGATLKIVIIDWAQKVLGFGLDKATYLTIAVAVGIAIGAFIAALTVKLEHAVKVECSGLDLLLDERDRGAHAFADRPGDLRLRGDREVAADVLEERTVGPRKVLRVGREPRHSELALLEHGAARLESGPLIRIGIDQILERAVDRP